MKIDISYETVDAIVIAGLKETLAIFEKDIKNNKEGIGYFRIFDSDLKKDLKMLKKHREACKLLLEWYGGEIE